MTPADLDELDQLRLELKDRLERHPPSTWSCDLLAVAVAAIDLQFGRGARPAKPVLCLVQSDTGGTRSRRPPSE